MPRCGGIPESEQKFVQYCLALRLIFPPWFISLVVLMLLLWVQARQASRSLGSPKQPRATFDAVPDYTPLHLATTLWARAGDDAVIQHQALWGQDQGLRPEKSWGDS